MGIGIPRTGGHRREASSPDSLRRFCRKLCCRAGVHSPWTGPRGGSCSGCETVTNYVFLEYLTRTKGHDAARRDADFFTGPWIPALPGALASHDKVPKTGDLDGISLL